MKLILLNYKELIFQKCIKIENKYVNRNILSNRIEFVYPTIHLTELNTCLHSKAAYETKLCFLWDKMDFRI